MKLNSNKGMFLESVINNSNEFYLINKIAYIQKYETPIKICSIQDNIVTGKLFKKGIVDYFGIYQGKYVCFEAKQTINHLFSLDNIQDHQKEYLYKVKEFGGDAWIILFFNKFNKFFKIEIEPLFNANKKSIDLEWCKQNAKELSLIFPGRINYL